MKKGKTESGFEFTVDEEILESWEFVELLAEVDENTLKSVSLLKLLLGKEQIDKLKEHLGGKPKAADMFTALKDIMNSLGDDVKNS